MRRALLSITLMTLALAWPTLARADLYKYRGRDGGVLISSERRPDLELLEVISGGSGGGRASEARASKPSKKKRDNTSRAKQARARHLARHDEPEPGERARQDAFDDIVREASAAYDVPSPFIKAVIRVESNFNPLAISHAGAQGLMQLMPRTAKSLGVRDPFDPRQNIFGGTKLLRLLIDRYDGDINLILAAYNAGDVAVNRYDGIPYPQTRDYVASVYRWYKVYSSQERNDL